ncbi:hypothetical protein PanWU01x14_337020 [Parasponia andersonii]|uniref:Uncharacterized protein n=1 Tax=Parasponia andersonii TaxID=3476 RepID=A0A2P5AFQ2_PARAD|nr:hypothetical protein PanWU01x14_337020 [Parasponia andersonii]
MSDGLLNPNIAKAPSTQINKKKPNVKARTAYRALADRPTRGTERRSTVIPFSNHLKLFQDKKGSNLTN